MENKFKDNIKETLTKKILAATIACILVLSISFTAKTEAAERQDGVMLGDSWVVDSNGTLWAWGRNDSGQLGDGTTMHRYSPVRVMDNVALPTTTTEVEPPAPLRPMH